MVLLRHSHEQGVLLHRTIVIQDPKAHRKTVVVRDLDHIMMIDGEMTEKGGVLTVGAVTEITEIEGAGVDVAVREAAVGEEVVFAGEVI